MQEQIPASLSLFLGGEIGILVLCTCAIVYGTEPCHRQAGASLTYASILVPLLRSRVRYKPCFPTNNKYIADLHKSVQKQSSELFLAMTTKQRGIKRLSFELLVRSGRSANKTEALSKTYTYSRTLVLRNARTYPCFYIFVSRRRNWDFGALHLCNTAMALNPAIARLALHSCMQAYSFRYYGTLCLQIPEGK